MNEDLVKRPVVKVALAQMDVEVYGKEKNERTILELIGKAAKRNPDLVVLPELANLGIPLETTEESLDKYRKLAEFIPGPFTNKLEEEARDKHIFIYIGLAEKDKRDQKHLHNVGVLFSPKGKIIVYRKVHLYKAALTGLDEQFFFTQGEEPMVVSTEIGSLGLLICYDTCHPEYPRILALAGAEVLLLLAGWPITGGPRWEALLPARAIENQLFLVSAAIGGEKYYGNSMAVDYSGRILARTKEDNSVEFCTLNLNEIRSWRESLPYFRDSRPTLYKKFYKQLPLRDIH